MIQTYKCPEKNDEGTVCDGTVYWTEEVWRYHAVDVDWDNQSINEYDCEDESYPGIERFECSVCNKRWSIEEFGEATGRISKAVLGRHQLTEEQAYAEAKQRQQGNEPRVRW